jgi:serine/threonine protein kinase
MAGIYHRDLKPENLFLTDEFIYKGEVHIADFDRSK